MAKSGRSYSGWLRVNVFAPYSISEENTIQVIFVSVAMAIGFIAVGAIGILALVQGDFVRAITDFASCVAFVACFVLLTKKRGFDLVKHFMLLGFALGAWFAFANKGGTATSLFFPFAFPLLAYFLNARKSGTAWVALFLLGETVIALLVYLGALDNGAAMTTVFVRLIILLVLSVITFFFSLRVDRMVSAYFRLAYFDVLTELPNRNSLISSIGQNTAALIILSIDDFKEINALYGYAFGDTVLTHAARILQNYLKDPKIRPFRLSGSEFAAAIVKNRNVDVGFLKTISEKLMQAFEDAPIENDQQLFRIHVSIGVGFNRETPDQLLHLADLALKQAKKSTIRYQVFQDTDKSVKVFQNYLVWSNILEHSLENDLVFPYFQPIFSNTDGSLVKYESLIRISDEFGNIHNPGDFLGIAKKLKIYPRLTRIMVRKTIAAMKNFPHGFSVNLSYDDFTDSLTRDLIVACLKENESVASRLTFEILESESIENKELVSDFITDAKSYGCQIAIDDFGSGYANFDYLVHLDFDVLKIDGSLIRNVHNDRNAEQVVTNIVEFARKRNVVTVAEFVHDREVLNKVTDLGIDYSQGFFLGKPGPIAQTDCEYARSEFRGSIIQDASV